MSFQHQGALEALNLRNYRAPARFQKNSGRPHAEAAHGGSTHNTH
jgi:hypothetical protein